MLPKLLPRAFRRRSSLLAHTLPAAVTAAVLCASMAAPAAAAEIRPDSVRFEADATAEFTVCLGPAAASAGFADTQGIGAEAAIDCLAYYGITKGRTPTSFAPGRPVTRSQMALFLHRAGAAVEGGAWNGYKPSTAAQSGFDDLDGLPAERVEAITVLNAADVLAGRGAGFEPGEPITRAEMSVALIGFLRVFNPDLFTQRGEGALALPTGGVLDHFADARSSQPAATDTAISYAYELGITTGTAQTDVGGGTRFAPEEPVLRKQMASFITRTLAHTNLRPRGVTAQQDRTGAIVASVRGAHTTPPATTLPRFHPPAAADLRVEAFRGRCAAAFTGPSSSPCIIDSTDVWFDTDGNAEIGALTSGQIGTGVTVTVWAGSPRDRFDRTDPRSFFELTVRPPDPATIPATAIVPETATGSIPQQLFSGGYEVVFQLRSGSEGTATLRPATTVGLDGRRPAEYSVITRTFEGQPSSDALRGDNPAGVGALIGQQEEQLLRTDSTGRLRFTVTASDPDPQAANYRTVQWVVEARTNAPNHPDGQKAWRGGWAVFADAEARSAGLEARSVRSYYLVGGTQTATLQVTLTDQFGRTVPNRRVTISSSLNIDANSDGDYTDTGDTLLSVMPSARSTGSDGRVRFAYEHRGRAAAAETVTVSWDGDARGSADTGCRSTDNPQGQDICVSTKVYWALQAATAAQAERLEVLVADTADGAVVVDSDTGDGVTPTVLFYDDADVFDVNGDLAGFAEFEKALNAVSRGARTATMGWSSYQPDNSGDVARFVLVTAAKSS